MVDQTYFNTINEWRKAYEERLGAPDGWLSISGLFWLREGDNLIGTDPTSQVVLPQGAGPAKTATIHVQGTQIKLAVSEEVKMTCNEKPVSSMDIKLNEYGSSDWFFIKDVKFAVIQRGTRYGVRVYDQNNPERRKYLNVRWFAVNEAQRVQAKYHALEKPLMLTIVNVLGDSSEEPCEGYVEFTLGDKAYKLYPLSINDGKGLWFMFKDGTNNKLTYNGGRFMTADGPKDGIVTLDFNKAHNPPCAYTHFATCPLPPDMNRLPVDIIAGEMTFPMQ